jgi:hypothetical protein
MLRTGRYAVSTHQSPARNRPDESNTKSNTENLKKPQAEGIEENLRKPAFDLAKGGQAVDRESQRKFTRSQQQKGLNQPANTTTDTACLKTTDGTTGRSGGVKKHPARGQTPPRFNVKVTRFTGKNW